MDLTNAFRQPQETDKLRPIILFEMRPVEDRTVVSPDGVTKMKDVAFVTVRAPGSKESAFYQVEDWLKQLQKYANDERVPAAWPHEYREVFELWKNGQEIPTIGTPIKTWPPLSPAQRTNILTAGITTVEQLANSNDQIRGRIGMNSSNLIKMAQEWLRDSTGRGATAQALEANRVALSEAKDLIKAQAEAIARLEARLEELTVKE